MAEIFLSGSEDQLSKSAVRGDTSGEQRNSQIKKNGRLHRCWNSEDRPGVCETGIQHQWRLGRGLAALTNTNLGSAAVGGEKRGGEQG